MSTDERRFLNDAECDDAQRLYDALHRQGDPYAIPKVVEHFLRLREQEPREPVEELGVWELIHEARFWHGDFGGCTPDEALALNYVRRAASLAAPTQGSDK